MNDGERQCGSAEVGLAARLVPILIALGPPVAVSGWLWAKIQDNLLISIIALIGYWAVIVVVGSSCGQAVPWAISGYLALPRRSTVG